MVNHGSIYHQKLVLDTIIELQHQGYNVVKLQKGIPDAIAVKDDLIYAVESLITSYIPENNIERLNIVIDKRKAYTSFDGVIFKFSNKKTNSKLYFFETLNRPDTFVRKDASKIVDDWISESFGGK